MDTKFKLYFLLTLLTFNSLSEQAKSFEYKVFSKSLIKDSSTSNSGKNKAPIPKFKRPRAGGFIQPRSTGRRGKCKELEHPLVALVPSSEDSSKGFLGVTSSEYPVFWFYIPPPPVGIDTAHFRLLDSSNKNQLKQRHIEIKLRPQAEIIGLRLPNNSKPLLYDQTYKWSISLICDIKKPSKNPTAVGLSKRVKSESNQESLNIGPNNFKDSLRKGLWHESLSILFDKIKKDRQNQLYKYSWREFITTYTAFDATKIPEDIRIRIINN